MNDDQITINKLFRDLIRVYSSSKTSLIGLDSFRTAIKELICSKNEFGKEILKLSNTIKNTQPRMFPLDNLMLILDEKIKSLKSENNLSPKSICEIIDEFKRQLQMDLNDLIKEGVQTIENGDFIVIHSIEENIEHLIPTAKKSGMNFKIMVLKQDIATTKEILNILNENQIEFEVIPEYDLVHYFDKITKLFIGTQALTSDNHLICDPGTSNIVSECHIHEIPIYLFLKTLKFSHYPASDQNIKKNSYKDTHDDIEYDFSIHSNDIIKLNLIDHIITEKGDIPLEDLSSVRKNILQ